MAKRRKTQKPRRGEIGPVTYYRTDRFYSENGGWYFKTREGEELGPFDDKAEAKEALEMHILLNSDHVPGADKSSGQENRI